MTARFYHIEDNNFTIDFHRESWRIRILKKMKGNKAGKAKSSINGYWSFKCAENDLPRLNAHMSQGPGLSRLDRFIPILEGTKECSYSSEVCCAPCEPLIKPKRKSHDCDGDVSAKSEVDEGKF